MTNLELEKFLPVARSTGKPQVWLTKSDAIQSIRNALDSEKERMRNSINKDKIIEIAREAGMVIIDDEYSLLPFIIRFTELFVESND